MSDSVKFIFKTLIKVPCFIMASFLIFNIFAFSFTYFRLLGFSYLLMQTAVENNYIPPAEENQLKAYLNGITSAYMVDNATITYGDSNNRKQYGQPVTVGVSAHYRFIWPLTPREQSTSGNTGFDGLHGSGYSGTASDSVLAARRQAYENNVKNNINISYTVPGLKYYADME